MVRTSLVAKSLLYAVTVVALSVPPAMWIGHMVFEQGRRDYRAVLAPQLQAAARELERTGGTPTSEQLDDLGELSHHDVRFVPWSQTTAYPAALAGQKLVMGDQPERPPTEGATPSHHWVRIDRDGHPVGALEFRQVRLAPWFRGPNQRQPFFPPLAWLWPALIVLVIVPPIWFWVIRPLRAMAAVAHRLGGGDLETPVTVTRRDEFGDLELAFEHMRVELRRAMEMKERLLTDVSHEIRGPLSRMTLALPLIRQEGQDSPMLDLFGRELRTADELLERVLQLARGRRTAAHAPEPMDLAEVARQVVAERAIVAERNGIQLSGEFMATPIEGNPRAIEIAVGNLVDNALKYTLSGGHVRVVTSVEGDQVFCRVIDDGPGIAPEHLPQIFEPFYRPDDSRSRETGGTGLGLSIVRGIAQTHQGRAELHSTVGHGTTAELALPRASAPKPQETRVAS